MDFYSLLGCCRPIMIDELDMSTYIREKILKQYPDIKLSVYAHEETQRLEDYLLSHENNRLDLLVENLFDELLEGFMNIKAKEDIGLFYVEAAFMTAIYGIVGLIDKYKIKPSSKFTNKWESNGYFLVFIEGKSMLDAALSDDPLKLPIGLDTARAREYIGKAIEKGLISPINEGLRWNIKKKGGKARLAYFLYRVFCQDDTGKDNGLQFPETALGALFGEERLGKARSQLINNKKQGYEEIDRLFD